MLFSTPTEYGAGLTLWGDYYDLKAAHGTISDLVGKGQLEPSLQEFALALAYDVRHAYERQREEKEFGIDEYDRVRYRGVSILWPYYLSQVAMLRQAAAFLPTSRHQQAGLYLLEDCARSALLEYDANVGTECFAWLENAPSFSPNYLLEFINCVARDYVTRGRPGKSRFKRLPRLLRSMSSFSQEYIGFSREIGAIAAEKKCSPQELGDWTECPHFKL